MSAFLIKTTVATFGQLLINIGQLFDLTAGHTDEGDDQNERDEI